MPEREGEDDDAGVERPMAELTECEPDFVKEVTHGEEPRGRKVVRSSWGPGHADRAHGLGAIPATRADRTALRQDASAELFFEIAEDGVALRLGEEPREQPCGETGRALRTHVGSGMRPSPAVMRWSAARLRERARFPAGVTW